MRRYLVGLGLFLVSVAAALAFFGRTGPVGDEGLARAQETERGAPREGGARSKRDALRQEILRRVPGRPGVRPDQRSSADGGALLIEVQNRLRGSEKLAASLSEAFTPLAAQCIAEAEARRPELFGMLAIGMQTLALADVGAIVEVADPAVTNEIGDGPLIECVREAAFTLVIPPPLTTGRVNLELTFRVLGRNWR